MKKKEGKIQYLAEMEFGEQVADSKLTNMSPCNIILFYYAGVHFTVI